MAEMTLQEIRDFVRASLDTDEEDLPDSLLDSFISDGWERAIGASRTWNFYAVEYTITTVASQQAYNVSGADADLDVPSRLESITDVRGDTWQLIPLDHARARQMYRRTSPSSSRPTRWSEFGQEVFLWPIPDTAYEVQVTGYRLPTDWIGAGAGSTPDAPAEFSNIVAYAALAQGWAQQSDPEMATFYSQSFQRDVARVKARYATPLSSGPFVLNGPPRQSAYPIDRAIYDWE